MKVRRYSSHKRTHEARKPSYAPTAAELLAEFTCQRLDVLAIKFHARDEAVRLLATLQLIHVNLAGVLTELDLLLLLGLGLAIFLLLFFALCDFTIELGEEHGVRVLQPLLALRQIFHDE